MLSTCRNVVWCNPWIPWMESSTPGSAQCISPVSPGAGSYFRLSTSSRGAGEFCAPARDAGSQHIPKKKQDLTSNTGAPQVIHIPLCGCSAWRIPDVLCLVSCLGWSCRRSSGKLRSSSVKSQVLLLQAQLRSWRLAHVSNNSLDLPRKMTLDAARSCQLFPPYPAGQLFSCCLE